jgi:alpha-tubulin suppressor-like RCC1 family protein
VIGRAFVSIAVAASIGCSGAKEASSSPTVVGVRDIAVSGGHACAAMVDGTVRCWGDNGIGQLGNGTNDERCTRTPFAPSARFILSSSQESRTP